MYTIEIQNGLAENEADLAPEVVRRQLKALWITIPLYNLTLTLTKLSLIFLYRRLFPTHTYRILLILTLIFVIITGLWMVLRNGLAATWSFVESNVAIICACLPPLRPLLVRIFPKLIPSRMRSYQRDKDSRSNSNPNNNKAAEAAAGQPPPTISKSRTRKSLSKRGSRNEPEHIDFDFLSVYGAGGNMFAPGSTVSTSVWGDAGSVRSGVENGNKDGDGNGNGGGEGDSGGEGIQIMREVRWDSVSVSGSAEGASHGTGGWGDVEGRLSEGTRRSSGAPFLHPQWVGGNGFEW
ncbi:hypothetical protein AnigIFM63309_000063 [Aspergillus niger]|nr:hypothetical protein AnigIFM63309_000063 [Aspergillus niger]